MDYVNCKPHLPWKSFLSDDKIKLETIRSRFVTDFIKMHWLISVIDFHTKLIDFLFFISL